MKRAFTDLIDREGSPNIHWGGGVILGRAASFALEDLPIDEAREAALERAGGEHGFFRIAGWPDGEKKLVRFSRGGLQT